ncbi:hypothetical protein I3843_03G120400 [Carya illinoinensis]|nr:hypothetical protein I3843_03G120400 [Carya illinoinensis]
MATIWPLLLLFSVISTAEAQQPEQSFFRPGTLLTPRGTNSSWLSRSGLYAFGFYKLQGNGYAVGIFISGIPQKTLVWTANRDNPPLPDDVKLNFTSDGRLVLQTAQGMETGIAGNTEGAAAASMLDSGNFVLYNSDNLTIWQSFNRPTDTFLPGIFRLIMQQDGWLAMYPVGTPFTLEYGYWGAGVSGEGTDVSLNFDADGRLYLLNGTGMSIVNITTGDPTKGPKDECDPKGLCGINAFCDQDAGCECLPGFKRVNQDDWASGCERNFDSKSCKSNDAVTGYNMEAELHTVWQNDSYSILNSSTQDACGEACLGDCNCEVAQYKDGECRKQRLPLRFGRRQQGDSSVALIKVGTSPLSPDPSLPKESENKNQVNILIIGVSLLSFACIILAISGIAIYKYRRWLYRNVSNTR